MESHARRGAAPLLSAEPARSLEKDLELLALSPQEGLGSSSPPPTPSRPDSAGSRGPGSEH